MSIDFATDLSLKVVDIHKFIIIFEDTWMMSDTLPYCNQMLFKLYGLTCFVHKFIHMYAYMYMYSYVYVYIYVCIYMYICIHVYVYVCSYTYIFTYIQPYFYIYIGEGSGTYNCILIYVHINTHKCIPLNIHAHIVQDFGTHKRIRLSGESNAFNSMWQKLI